jgi:hypothetical protein
MESALSEFSRRPARKSKARPEIPEPKVPDALPGFPAFCLYIADRFDQQRARYQLRVIDSNRMEMMKKGQPV